MKKAILLLLALLCLTGCAAKEEVNNTLWVVTELSNSDGMNYQADSIAARLEEKHPGLTVELEVLPTDEEERELRLKKLRTMIMSGKGPDVYLLPTGTELVSDEPDQDENIPIEPLFSDVNQAMRNSIFLDVSPYFQPDDALKPEIMEAGMLKGKRYVLPLRFQVPVVYTRPDLCEEYGITEEALNGSFMKLAKHILSLADAENAATGLKFPENASAFGQFLDYSKGEVLVSQEEIAEFMALYQQHRQITAESIPALYEKWDYHRRRAYWDIHYEGTIEPSTGEARRYSDEQWDRFFPAEVFWPARGQFAHEQFNLIEQHIMGFYHWSTSGMPVYTGFFSDIFETLGVTKTTGQEIAIYPIRSTDGSVTASITYWGAVGGNCESPELAYEFLSQFLGEEFQWDIDRPRGSREGGIFRWEKNPQFDRMVENSFPVRTVGCVAPLWDNVQYYSHKWDNQVPETKRRMKQTQNLMITEEDIPELNWHIDQVYFPVDMEEALSLSGYLDRLNAEDGTPTDVNIEELAQEVCQNLWWHLAEG